MFRLPAAGLQTTLINRIVINMKIEKINENQIRCTLTKADLEERHIRLSELAYGTEKAKDLFRDMMQQANSQFGFEADNMPLMIEAIPVSADSIILIISKVEDPEELDTRFSKFTPFGSSQQGEDTPVVEYEGADDILDIFQKIYDAKAKAMERRKKEGSKQEAKPKSGAAPAKDTPEVSVSLMRNFHFQDLDTVIAAAQMLNNFFQDSNSLYKDSSTGTYSLILHQNQTSPEDFNKVCNMLSEYGKGSTFTPAGEAYLAEHDTCIVADQALQKLSGL